MLDVLVLGGGHAGCEAAAAAARMGASVGLLTHDLTTIGAMSCNPAIGGIGKGHLVRELDIFDGLMAQAADQAGIHYRMLNRSKGAAVQGPRVQADRQLYAQAIQRQLRATTGLQLLQGQAVSLILQAGRARGLLLLDGTALMARSVILATGTFLGGRLFRGAERLSGGRIGEQSAHELAVQLRDLDLPIARLKTGTPPRLDGRTIDWARVDRQASDGDPWCFSPLSNGRSAPQLACGITRTNGQTHAIVADALDQSPLYQGAIEGRGPRYCPSIEDKIARFGDRDGHQVFLEPEGLDDATVYPNGISTSLPTAVQQRMIQSIAGLEHARIVQPGYAVEYDHIDPRALNGRLGLKALPGLFCAGQINGTTGYEEAAGQGLVAGMNAAAEALGRTPILLGRDQAYLGVMIDDLVTQGVTEPYRMLTARAEFRLRLRADNAASRLGEVAVATGVIGSVRRKWLAERSRQLSQAHQGERADIPADVMAEAEQDAIYAPYVARQEAEIQRLHRDEALSLKSVGDFATVKGLSSEMVERLRAAQPATLAAAGRVRGITPAALTALLISARQAA